MLYQAVFSKYGEHIHIPIDADTWEQAKRLVLKENPSLASWPVTIKYVKRGEMPKDDRAELKFDVSQSNGVESQMGRPSQGRSFRLQATITPEQARWLDAQKARYEVKSLSDVVYRLIRE